MKDNNIIQDAINCLKRLHKENAELKAYKDVNEDFKKAWEELKAENEQRKDLYTDLLEIVEPYLSDFTGYDENEQAFNIVLAVKELLSEFSIENDKLKSCLQEIKEIAMGIMDDDIEESSAYSDARRIIDLINKAESEG